VYGGEAGVSREFLRGLIGLEGLSWGDVRPSAAFWITRSNIFGSEHSNAKQVRLSRRYRRLFHKERTAGAYPVVHVRNDSTIEDAVRQILSVLQELRTPRDGETRRDELLTTPASLVHKL
jgi:hypothetical protein